MKESCLEKRFPFFFACCFRERPFLPELFCLLSSDKIVYCAARVLSECKMWTLVVHLSWFSCKTSQHCMHDCLIRPFTSFHRVWAVMGWNVGVLPLVKGRYVLDNKFAFVLLLASMLWLQFSSTGPAGYTRCKWDAVYLKWTTATIALVSCLLWHHMTTCLHLAVIASCTWILANWPLLAELADNIAKPTDTGLTVQLLHKILPSQQQKITLGDLLRS